MEFDGFGPTTGTTVLQKGCGVIAGPLEGVVQLPGVAIPSLDWLMRRSSSTAAAFSFSRSSGVELERAEVILSMEGGGSCIALLLAELAVLGGGMGGGGGGSPRNLCKFFFFSGERFSSQ